MDAKQTGDILDCTAKTATSPLALPICPPRSPAPRPPPSRQFFASVGLPVAMAVAMPVRCVGHALVRRVEVQVAVRPERAALVELALLLGRVSVEWRACHGCGQGVGRV